MISYNLTKEEVLKKIKELEELVKQLDELDELDEKVGFENDEIFLLSTEEYEKYKDIIPEVHAWWWLRSPGNYQNTAAGVYNDDSVNCDGYTISSDFVCVRPALDFTLLNKNLKLGAKFVHAGVTWTVIDAKKYIAICDSAIGFERFDDNESDYAISHIRGWLLNWYKSQLFLSFD